MQEQFENQPGQDPPSTTVDDAIENALGQIGILLNPLDAAAIAVKAKYLWPVLDSPLVRTAVGSTASVQQRAVATVSLIPQVISSIDDERDRHIAEMWFAVDPAYVGLRLTRRYPILLEKRKIPVGTAPSRRNTILALMGFYFRQATLEKIDDKRVAKANLFEMHTAAKEVLEASLTHLYLAKMLATKVSDSFAGMEVVIAGSISHKFGARYLRTLALADWCAGLDPRTYPSAPIIAHVATDIQAARIRHARDYLISETPFAALEYRYAVRDHFLSDSRLRYLAHPHKLPKELGSTWSKWLTTFESAERASQVKLYRIAARSLRVIMAIQLIESPTQSDWTAVVEPGDIARDALADLAGISKGPFLSPGLVHLDSSSEEVRDLRELFKRTISFLS